jgi:hypothetical protein
MAQAITTKTALSLFLMGSPLCPTPSDHGSRLSPGSRIPAVRGGPHAIDRVLRDGRRGPDDHIYVPTRCRAFASARIHPFGLDHRSGGGSRQVGDERLGGFRFVGVRRDGGREHDFLL